MPRELITKSPSIVIAGDPFSECDEMMKRMAPEMDKAEIDAALDYMRELARDPIKLKEMEAAWNAALDRLEQFYLQMRPRPRSSEVRSMNETARARFACAVMAKHQMSLCADLAVAQVTG